MIQAIYDHLNSLNIVLPPPPPPAANYVPFVVVKDLVYISGQLPLSQGSVTYKGQLGRDMDISTAQEAARLCALNVLSVLQEACEGDLRRVQQCLRLGGFVNAAPDFTDHPKVVNGASDLMGQVFGERGRHARAAVGCSSLPLGACVEIEALFRIVPLEDRENQKN